MKAILLTLATLACVAGVPVQAEPNTSSQGDASRQTVRKQYEDATMNRCFGQVRATVSQWIVDQDSPPGEQIRVRKDGLPEYDRWWIATYCSE